MGCSGGEDASLPNLAEGLDLVPAAPHTGRSGGSSSRVKSFLATVGDSALRAPVRPRIVVSFGDWRATLAQLLVSTRFHAGLLAIGVVVRVARFFSDRSLWLDESYLALNFMNRSYSGLLGTLDFGQGGPAGFLLMEKLVVDVLGDSELALRLIPCVAGIASLFLFYGVARRLLTPLAVPLALLIFAVGNPFVLYGGMVKQYSVDVAVALALLYLFLRVFEQPQFGARSALILTFAGVTAVWLSHPAAFVLAGVGAGAVTVMLLRGDRRGLVALSIPFAAWLASFGAMFLLTLREFRELGEATTWYTSERGSPHRNVYVMFGDSNLRLLHWAANGLAPVVALLGAVSMWATPRQRPRVVAGAVMLLTTLAAGYLGKYPAGQRFILFLLPLALLCLAEGVVRLISVLPRDLAATFAVVVAVVVVVPPLEVAVRDFLRPPKAEHIKPVLAYLGDRWQKGDSLYVSHGAQYALRYYLECSDCQGLPQQLRPILDVRPQSGPGQYTPALVSQTRQVVIGRARPIGPDHHLPLDIDRLAGRPRVWALFTHYFPQTEKSVLTPIEELGRQLECSPAYDKAFVCLYDLTPRSTPGLRQLECSPAYGKASVCLNDLTPRSRPGTGRERVRSD